MPVGTPWRRVDPETFVHVAAKLQEQLKNATEWRDVINSYFYRKSGIPDERGERSIEQKMVEMKGLEPSTSTLRTWRSPS